MKRVMAIRLASICRSVMYPHSMTFKPYSPKDREDPRHALPRRLPFCCLRYFTFLGINITKTLKNQLPAPSCQPSNRSPRARLPTQPELEARGQKLKAALKTPTFRLREPGG